MSRKHNNKGRSKGEGRYTRLMHFMMETPAWRSLTPYERTLYLEVAKIYDGANNGFLGLGVRRAAELCNMSVNKTAACFKTLEAKGFIEVGQASAFSRKDRTATEWRLTQYQCDRTHRAPSSAFQHWREDEAANRPANDRIVGSAAQASPQMSSGQDGTVAPARKAA